MRLLAAPNVFTWSDFRLFIVSGLRKDMTGFELKFH